MSGEHELRIAVAEGILSRSEADALREEARRLAREPLRLLVERGQLSEESLVSLRKGIPGCGAPGTPADPDATASVVAPPPADPDATSTLAPRAARAAPEPPAFPVAGWDRYQPVRFLGQGGMGKVFLARDVRLQRDVAIKFVHGDDRGSIARLISEARAQARVSHERVCKVYEVGEVQGEVYIAMEFIDGEPLGVLADRLTVEHKARMVRDAALGVHEAHRQGIIHRDLKPANVMVARGEDGDLHPYVMDFGMARFLRGGATETGTVLGTPHYMSPEQARGEVSRLDRRADVYSLGATLYALLTGAPPIPGSHALDVVNRIATEEPRPPRALDPDIPADLEAIALKCLEKDRSARYDSARALAEDLDRFLGGEPVLARPAGAWYRLRKRIQKHRRALAAAAVALAVVIVAVGFGLSARRQAAERERLARRFTELVERIESQARYSALSRLHDIRRDQAAVQARMGELEAEIRKAGPLAVGPGHYALGRGYLALGEEAKAREALESAWQHGYREPRAAYALALVMGHLYQEQLREAERIENKDRREAKKQEVAQRYRGPTLAYLKQSEGADVPSTAYVAALVAFYEDRLDEALQQLDAMDGGLPWFYEGPALRGDILLARASRRWNQGDREAAIADFEAGRRAYAAAAAIGESVPAIHEALGELEYAAMRMELYGAGDVAPRFDRAVEAARRALAVLPDHYASLVLEASLYRRFAEHRMNQGGDVEDLLEKAIAAAERAVAIAPPWPAAWSELAKSHYQWGTYRQGRNQDPGAELQKAIEILARVRPEARDYDDFLYLGLIFQTWADYEDQVGRDALDNRGKAIEAYLKATQLDEGQTSAWINLGTSYFMRASKPRTADPDGDLERARSALERARAQNPKHVVPYFYLGQIHGLIAERKRARGGDARPDLEAALARYREGLAINPRMWHLHNGAGVVLRELAREAWDRGGDPEPLLDQARAAFEQAIAVAPDQGIAYNNLGYALMRRARYVLERGDDPEPSVQAALAALRQAIARIPGYAQPWVNQGEAQAVRAGFELERGRDPRPGLTLAEEAASVALARNPAEGESHLLLGETRRMRALWQAEKGQGSVAEFDAAAQAFERAIDLAPENHDHRIAAGHLYGAWASWQRHTGRDPGPPLERGLALAREVLGARPEWPDALALRGSLLLVQAQSAGRAEDARARSADALADFTRALGRNPNLQHAWRSQTALARRLSTAHP